MRAHVMNKKLGYAILIIAALVAPFIVWTLIRALKGRFELHKKLARLVYPVWLYVAVTGVVVYLMLYQIYPAN